MSICCFAERPEVKSLGHSHQLKHVSVWIFEVNASAAVPIIELAVIEAPGGQRGEKGESGRRRHYFALTVGRSSFVSW
jgi:hypothetical protein